MNSANSQGPTDAFSSGAVLCGHSTAITPRSVPRCVHLPPSHQPYAAYRGLSDVPALCDVLAVLLVGHTDALLGHHDATGPLRARRRHYRSLPASARRGAARRKCVLRAGRGQDTRPPIRALAPASRVGTPAPTPSSDVDVSVVAATALTRKRKVNPPRQHGAPHAAAGRCAGTGRRGRDWPGLVAGGRSGWGGPVPSAGPPSGEGRRGVARPGTPCPLRSRWLSRAGRLCESRAGPSLSPVSPGRRAGGGSPGELQDVGTVPVGPLQTAQRLAGPRG